MNPFKGLSRGMASFMATTEFEKARIQATYNGDTEPPSEKNLVFLLNTLTGNDTETRASAGFSIICAKMQAGDSRNKWNYILKNLIVLDRTAEEGVFLRDIRDLKMEYIDNFTDKDQKNNVLGVDLLVRRYFRYIKAKASLYTSPNSIRIPRTNKKEYFVEHQLSEVLAELRLLNKLLGTVFEITETGNRGHLKFKLCQYVFLMLLQALMNIFSSAYLGIIVMLDKVFESDIDTARECLAIYQDFLQYTEMIVSFTRNHQFIKGFQGVSINDFKNPRRDEEVLQNLRSYIDFMHQKKNSADLSSSQVQEFERRASEFTGKRLSMQFTERPELLMIDSKDISKFADGSPDVHRPAQSVQPKDRSMESPLPISMARSTPAQTWEKSNSATFGLQRDNSSDDGSELASPNKLRAMLQNQVNELIEDQSGVYFTRSFNTFINMNEKDNLFDDRENFYSPDYKENYLEDTMRKVARMNLSQAQRDYSFPETAIAIVEENRRRNEDDLSSFEDVNPFDPEIFDKSVNFYSVSYDHKSKIGAAGGFDIKKQAGSLLSYFKPK